VAFATYILEALKSYGKADLGPLGIFELDYKPARWSVLFQKLDPPTARVHWSPGNDHSTTSYDTITSIVALKHDIPLEQADQFVRTTIQKLASTEDPYVRLGTIGNLRKSQAEGLQFDQFEINPKLEEVLKFNPIYLKILPNKPRGTFDWGLVALSALLLTLLFVLIGLWMNRLNPAMALPANPIISISANEANIKETNISPITTGTDTTAVALPLQNPGFIIITGTYCETRNVERAKQKIKAAGYEVYEQKVNKKCTRVGIQFAEHDPILTLEKIRNTLEPEAWLLEE
jgi:hypothetical protein